MINKRGGERLLSLYWFLIFIIIAIGVVSGVFIFNKAQVDIRNAEGNILADKIVNCFVKNGEVNKDLLDKTTGETISSTCGLVLEDKTGRYTDSEQYFVSVLFNENGNQKLIQTKRTDFIPFCGQEKSKKNIPLCVDKKLVVLSGNKLGTLEVLVIVRKVEQNNV